MKTLFLNPMTEKTGNVVRDVLYGCWCKGNRIGGGTVPPFNFLVLTALLNREGRQADFLDAQALQLPPAAVADIVKGYDLLVISTSSMSFTEDADQLLRFKNRAQGLKTALFGSHPTFMPNYCLSHPGVDYVVLHEPEETVLELATSLAAGKDVWDVPGLGLREPDGSPRVNTRRAFLKDLNSLPFPDVDCLPKGIHYYNPLVRRMPYITTTTSKGCPGKCIFCTAPAFDGNLYRAQSVDYVIRELRYFASKGIREVYFRDDTFFVNKKRDHAICQAIIDEKMDLTWIANARVDMIDEETMALAARAGCHTLKFGIESGSQEILDGIRKGYRLEQGFEVFDWAKKHGLSTHAHVMIGNPGDTADSIQQTIDYVLRLSPSTATFGICTPYPGTPLFDRVKAVAPEIEDGSGTDLSRLHTQGYFNEHFCQVGKEELPRLVRHAYRRFYLRPGYWLRCARENLHGPEDLRRIGLAASRLFNFMAREKD